MKQMADGLLKSWNEQEGFRSPSLCYAFEYLESTIALAIRMGFTTLYDDRFKNMTRPPLNPMGAVAL